MSNLPIISWMVGTRKVRAFVPVLVLMSMLLTLPGLTQAQGSYYDFPLSVVQTYTGNLAVQTSGTSFYSGVTTNSFNITIPTCAGPTNPTIVAAWLNYYTRWRSNSGDTTVPTFDNTLDVTVGSGTVTSQTAMAPTIWTGLLPGTTGGTDRNYYRNHGMIDITSQFSADYTAGSATTILIENFNLPAEVGNNSESYGVGLSVIYSCAEYPSATSTLYGGLDWFYYADTRDPMGVYSDLVCVNFAPVASPRTADIDGIFGGQANVVPPSAAYRGNRLWYLTGTASDPLPTESGNTPPAGVVATDLAAIEVGTPNSIWTSSLGQEWDRVDQSINIPANATWACLQAESSQQNGSDLGISGDLLAPIITIPAAPGQVAIGNFVWADDVTANGAFDTGETPLNGVSVQLYTSTQTPGVDTPVATTTTAGGGFYVFDNLTPGSYIVHLPASNFAGALSGYATCTGGGGDNANDDNVDENGQDALVNGGVSSTTIALAVDGEPTSEAGQGSYGGSLDDNDVNFTVDFCFTPAAPGQVAIGNFVWADDVTANGAFDTGETPLNGVAVQLYTSTQTPGVDTPVATTTTAGGGFYVFDNLTPGSYIVHIPASNFAGALSGYATCTGGGGDNANDDNVDENGQDALVNGGISSTTIALAVDGEPTSEAGQGSYGGSLDDNDVNFTVDFCFTPAAPGQVAIGNFVWADDVTANGAFDTGETPLNGVSVQLYTSTQTPGVDTPVATTTTAGGGFYLFDNLTPGSYIVHIPASNFAGALSGYATCTGGGGDNANDDNVDENGQDALVNGGISSTTIALAVDGEPTSEAGQGSYSGSLDDNDVNFTVDFCFTPSAPGQVAIGNFVWADDVTTNGAFDTGETPLNGVAVQLYTSTQTPGVDTPVATTTTAGGGFYVFDNLTPGSYIVHIPASNFAGALSGYATCTGGGGDNANDDNVDENGQDALVNGGISSTTIALAVDGEPTSEAGQGSYSGSLDDNDVNFTVDFCFTPAAPGQVAIGNFVWADDVTTNGAFDTGETPLNGVAVQLYTSTQTPGVDTPVATTTTAGGGFYVFDNLTPGSYIVHIPASNFAGALSGYATCTGGGGDNANDDNVDENGQDALVNGGVSSTTIALAVDGEPTGEAGQGSYTGTLDDNDVNFTVDFCFNQERVAIGNFVWEDNVTANGAFDTGESPLDGVSVQLYTSTQTPGVDTPIASTTTAGGGFYLFDSLTPGSYIVHLPASNFAGVLSGYSTCGGAGGDTANDDNVDENGQDVLVNGGVSSSSIALAADSEPTSEAGQGSYGGSLDDNNVNMTVDFCFTQERVALGNFIWADDGTQNGAFDVGETPLDGVTVQLYQNGQTPGVDTPIASTTTAGGGFYLFDDLSPSTYIVYVPSSNFSGPLSGYASCGGAGGDTANDDNADENGQDTLVNGGVPTGPISVLPDSEPTGEAGQGSYTGALDDDNVNMTVDFCFTQARVALGNFIWVDDGTQNGRFDTGETPLDGVTVQLYTSAQTPGVDTPVASTTTAGGGFYLFDNLAPGSYIVHLPAVNFSGPLSGYASCSGAGGDNANDDNVDENGQDTLDNGGISTLPINALPDSEPTGEAGQGSYTGSLDDDNVNMTIDFCVAVGVPVTPTPGPSGQPSIADPAIVKLVDPAFAQPNETVVWTITVSNPSGVTLNNVGFTDHVDDRLEILGTSATEGTVSASGQTVTFLIGSLAPNQVVTITVTTRIRSDAQVPFIIDNSATLGNPGDAYNGSSSARLLSVQSLPATGETPAWRAPLMMILVLTMGTGIVIYLNR